jgi:CRP/FNR family nitrogen fixation transcriptional regulator
MLDVGLDHIRHWHLAIAKGRIVYDAGDPTGAFYRVDKGCIRLQLMSEDGRRRVLAFCLPGDVFGLETGPAHSEGAEATEDCQLSRFSTSAITDPPIEVSKVISALGATSEMISGLFTHLEGLGRGSAEERLMWFLEWLATRQGVATAGGCVRLPMNRRDIADFLGLAQETLSRTFAKLEAGRLIAFEDSRSIRLRPPRIVVAGASFPSR